MVPAPSLRLPTSAKRRMVPAGVSWIRSPMEMRVPVTESSVSPDIDRSPVVASSVSVPPWATSLPRRSIAPPFKARMPPAMVGSMAGAAAIPGFSDSAPVVTSDCEVDAPTRNSGAARLTAAPLASRLPVPVNSTSTPALPLTPAKPDSVLSPAPKVSVPLASRPRLPPEPLVLASATLAAA